MKATPVVEHDFQTALALGQAMAVAWFSYAIVNAVGGYWMSVPIQLGGGLLTLGAWAWARGRPERLTPLVHWLCFTVLLGQLGLSFITGQSQAQAWWQMLIIPPLAATVLGRKGFFIWVAIVVPSIAAVHLSERWIHLTPAYVVSPAMRSFGGVMLTTLALGYVLYVRLLARRHIQALSEREQTIAAQADELERASFAISDARDQAVRALHGKTEFLATLSHELRAPLNGLLGLSSVLAETKLNPQQHELVRTLHQSATTMRKILNDVLDLSRIESGRLELREENVDLREVIGEVLDVFAPGAGDKGIEIASIVSPDVPHSVRADSVRFGQVLTNFVSNALKFTTEGEIVVELDYDGPRLRLSVRDTGPGIAPEERERLFRPFEQTAAGVESREIGSGLGLWISQRIVEAMGGTLSLESQVGRGSTFFVHWEPKRGDALSRDSSELPLGVHVLAVEDHEASARSLTMIARGLGMDLQIARTIGEALRLANDGLSLVLIDATLTGVTPVAAAEALRGRLRRIPLVLAAAPSVATMRSGVPAPFAASTLKPYRASRLMALLNDVLVPRQAIPTPVAVSPWRPLDVLVVDDDSTNRLVASLLLEKSGLRVLQAASGEEALAVLAQARVEVVLLDLHMPGLDGFETARRIRAEQDPLKRLWIVALTASVHDEDRQRCLDAGMDDFIPKPIEIGLFRAALERAQRGVRRRGTPSSIIPGVGDGGVRGRELRGLFEVLGGDTNELALLLDDYSRSSADLCNELRDAVARKDTKTAQRAVHTLASSSGQLGAYRLEAQARLLEQSTMTGRLPDEMAIDALTQERESAVAQLHQKLNELMAG